MRWCLIFEITFKPIKKKVEYSKEVLLLDVLKKAGIEIKAICGGKAKCGKCRVRVSGKFINDVTLSEKDLISNEDIKNCYRLACCTKIFGDTEIYIPWSTLATKQRLQIAGEEKPVKISPIIKKYILEFPETTIGDISSDFEKLKEELLKKFNMDIEKIDFEILKKLSEIISNNKGRVTIIVKNNEIIFVGSEEEIKKIYGIAIDLGTTKIAIYLVDLDTGKTIDAIGIMNPQIIYGEDVISRLNYAKENEDGSNKLREIVLNKINKEISNICKKNNINSDNIFETVVVGNTAMHHLFLGLPTKQLALSPFVSIIDDVVEIKARELNLAINKFGYVYFPPTIAGFVGSDHLAMIISSQIFKRKGNVLGIDIGTNTEIALKTDNVITCCSTASGPAFEGTHIKYGMRASKGAIDGVKIEKDNLNVLISTIDNYPPVGICGSGILDSVAEMLKTKIIDSSGKIIKGKRGVRERSNEELEYILTKKGLKKEYITITQKDIREIQLAKGAIRAGIDILIENAKLKIKDIDQIIMAGAFGTYLDISSSIEIGMFPDIPINRFRQIGNAAGIGAKQILISKNVREKAKELLKNIKYVELTIYPDFVQYFANAMRFS